MQANSATSKPDQCCSEFYEQDWVRLLAGDCFHPGGAALTRRTIDGMQLPPLSRVLDLGCGTGTTTASLIADYGYAATGLDVSERNLRRARQRYPDHGNAFVTGDLRRMPFADGCFDGIISECVLSLAADKPATLAELARVLAPHGRVGITDMAIEDTLPDDFMAAVAPWTCLADALCIDGYRELFAAAGLRTITTIDESQALYELVRVLKRQLLVSSAGAIATGAPSLDVGSACHWLARFTALVDSGAVRYVRFQVES